MAAEAPAAVAGPPLTSEEQDAKNGLYHATSKDRIVFFGDLEGNSLKRLLQPKNANTESQTNVLTEKVSNLTELDDYLTVSPDRTLVLHKNVILVCLGDVIGDGPDNIELARTLLKLKENNKTSVILITGNRDVNKVRLGHELEPTEVCMAELKGRVEKILTPELDAFDGFEFAFKRNNTADFDYMFSVYPTSIASKRGCLERVTHVLETTSMGEKCGWRFLVDEYLTIRGFTPEELTSNSISDEVKSYIYVYLVQAMSGNIECDGAPEFNNIFEELLMAGHLMACIETPDRGKFGLMHSLPPRMLIPTDPGRIYKEQFGKTVIEAQEIFDSEINFSKKVELNVGLAEFNSYVKDKYSKDTADPSKKRLLLEFVSGITSGSFDAYTGKNSFSGLNLPVSNQTFNKAGFELLAKTAKIQTGGKMDDLKSVVLVVNHIDMKDFSRIICSHKPQGYIGAKVKFGKQLYYCVDVSKIDDQDYDTKERYGCCFLVINLSSPIEADDTFIGRIMMKETQFPEKHYVFRDNPISPYPFDNKQSLYVNYIQSPISAWNLSDWNDSNPPGNFPQKLKKLIYMNEKYDFNFENGPKFTKMPTLKYEGPSEDRPAEMMNYLGGSRTRKRRSRYLKKSARTTHKRRHISKKRKNNNNKRKDKKSKRSSTAR